MDKKTIYKMIDLVKLCPDCGKPYLAKSNRQLRCETCGKLHRNQYKAEYLRNRRLAKKKEREEAKASEAKKQETVPNHPCPYCGRITNHPYCNDCHLDWFDNVHMMFGQTNGWDRKPRTRVKIASGWRGQKVIGAVFAQVRHGE